MPDSTIFNASVAAAGEARATARVASANTLQVLVTCDNAAAAADIAGVKMLLHTPVHPTVATVAAAAPVYTPVATAISGANLALCAVYDVRGLDKVDLVVINAAAASRNIQIHTFLS